MPSVKINDNTKLQLFAWYGLAVLLIAFDQITKHLAVENLEQGVPYEVLPVLNFTLHYNTGAAFSFLANASWGIYLLSVLSAIVSVVLAVWISRIYQTQRLLTAALSFVLGGALGNFYDRAFLGKVTDFISCHWGDWYFATFNIADMAISFGAFLMIVDMIINPESKRKNTEVTEDSV